MIPAASVVTRKSLGEFLLLKKSLETYHEVKWYVSSDEFSHEKLSKFQNVKSLPVVKTDECSHGTDDPVKNRLFLELVMTKFDALRAAMSEHGWGLFVDSDIFFTAPIEDRVLELMRDPGVDAVLSPHMTNNLTLETQVLLCAESILPRESRSDVMEAQGVWYVLRAATSPVLFVPVPHCQPSDKLQYRLVEVQ